MIINFIKNILSSIKQGSDRSVLAKKNIIGMFFLKGISIFINLLIVPLTIGYLSSYKYGLWLTISSLVSWLSFFDIGFGNGLRNKFIESISIGKKKLAKIYVSTTYAILIILIIFGWILFSIVSFQVEWTRVLNAPTDMSNELKYVIFIAITNFSFQFSLRLISTLFVAIQKPAIAALFDTVSQLLVVLFIMILIHFTNDGSLIYLSISQGVSYISVLLIGSIWAYKTILKDYSPNINYVRFKYAKDLMSLGLKFFFMQIIAIIIYQTDNIVISRILGPSQVTVYNISYKYMQVLNMIFMIVLTPFWSAFTEAKAKMDYDWMKKVTKKLWMFFILLSTIGLLLDLISSFVYKLWIGKTIFIPFMITVLMYFYQMLNIWGTLHTQLLAGLGKIKLQLYFSAIIGLLYLPVITYLCKMYGLNGILVGNILLMLFFTSWFGPVQISKILNQKAKGIWNE